MAADTGVATSTPDRLVELRTAPEKLETMHGLDTVSEGISAWLRRLLGGRLGDVLHGVWLGHPLHPALVQAPVGAWVSASVLDAMPGNEASATVLAGFGTAAAIPAAAAGLADWASLAPEQRRVGIVHAAANVTAVALQAASVGARLSRHHRPAKILSLAGLMTATVGAYLGGHLSYRQAASVNYAAPMLRSIPDGWHAVCGYDELRDGDPIVRTIADVPILLFRSGGAVTAMVERCAHQGGPLGEGDLVMIDGRTCVVCPWHGSSYRLHDGAVVRGPAATDQPRLQTRVRDGQVEVSVP